MIKLLKRYAKFDDSPKGTVGVKYNLMLTFPELQSNPVIPRLLELYIDPRSRTLYAENFVYFFALLSTKTPISKKREGMHTFIPFLGFLTWRHQFKAR